MDIGDIYIYMEIYIYMRKIVLGCLSFNFKWAFSILHLHSPPHDCWFWYHICLWMISYFYVCLYWWAFLFVIFQLWPFFPSLSLSFFLFSVEKLSFFSICCRAGLVVPNSFSFWLYGFLDQIWIIALLGRVFLVEGFSLSSL